MRLELTGDQWSRKREFAAFVDSEIIPRAAANDKAERLDEASIRAIKESGYLGSMIPHRFNGMEFDNVTIGILNEELGRGCSSVRSLLTVHGMTALAVMRWGTEEQRSYWLPKLATGEKIGAFGLSEPKVGSDAKSVETTAERVEGGFRLKGRKRWITMGQIADVVLVFAKCGGEPSAFLVETSCPGFSVTPIGGMLGVRASMLAELTMEDCFIPADCLIGGIGTGLSHVALHCLDYGRYTVAAGCVGLGQACLEQSVLYARNRVQFGVPLTDNQLIQQMITEMHVDVKAARLLCYQAGYLKDQLDPDSIMETWAAKYYASVMVNKVSGYAVQIHGAKGCSGDYDIERYFRDARVNEIIEGTTQMHEMLIARSVVETI